MDKRFDERLKKDLVKGAEPLPDSYTERVAALLDDLPHNQIKHKKSFKLRYAAALAVFLLMASGAQAAVNMYQEYLGSMSQGDKKELNERTQRVADNSDHFSRKLLDGEREKIEHLRDKYENEGLFPKEKIIETDKKNEVETGKLTFCYENSTFYIPDEELTDEEILKIIDFWERRDYAVKEENREIQVSDKRQKISQEEAVRIAKETLQQVYGLDVDSVESSIEFDSAKLSENESMPSYFIYLSKASWNYDTCTEVDSENGTVNQVSISHKTKEECVSGIKVNEDKYKKYAGQIYNILSAIGEMEDDVEEIRLVYKYCKDGMLSRGNVKYLVKLKDGSGYVFLYSANTKLVYNFYKVYHYVDTLRRENSNAKRQKQNAILVKSKVIMK